MKKKARRGAERSETTAPATMRDSRVAMTMTGKKVTKGAEAIVPANAYRSAKAARNKTALIV
jgi:hypothetical protein